MSAQFVVSTKVTADASQYTSELTRAGQTTATYTQQVQTGSTQVSSALQSTATAAQAMGSGLRVAGIQGAEGLNATTTAARGAQSAGTALLASLREQIAVSGKSTDELLRYRAAQSGVAAEAAPLILQLQNQRAAQQLAAESARAEEAAQRANAAAKQQSVAAQESFLAGLRDQAALQGKSQTEVMRYRAAQLGVTEGAEQYIRALEQGNSVHRVGTLSAKEHANAMRMLPMQMTDVVTSMASGMPVWMVAIQQGGQIKDSFGGAGNAMRAMLGTITPTVAAVGLLAGAVGLGALAYAQGSKEADGYRHAIVMTGNAAGTSVNQLTDMARAMSAISGTQGAAAESLTALAGTGAIASENLQQFATVAIDLERRVGQPIKTTAQHLEELAKAPLQASLKLNEQYHYLTDAVYRQIKALQDQGKQEDAASLAQRTYAGAMAERTAELRSNLGTLERTWEGLGSTARRAWDAMLNIGRAATLSDVRAKIEDTNRQINDLIAGDGFGSTGGGAATGTGARGRAAQIERLKQQLGELQAKAAPLEAEDAQAQIRAQKQATDTIELAARQRVDALSKSVRSQAEIRRQEIDQLNRDRETLRLSTDAYNKLLAGINEKYKDKKAGGTGQIAVSDNELATLQGQLQAARLYHEQLVTLGSGASELNAGERESLKIGEQLARVTDAKTTARLREKQAIADALGVQLRSNEGLEKSLKAHQASIDAAFKDADAITQRAAAQEAANATLGKSKTAVEQLTLAELQKQMAEAQATDSFDPKYIAGLELKIAAQKRYVNALGQADYKTAEEHANELLRNAQELGRAYEDEQQLSGMTALEREKITAQRQVELRYAKELAAIDAKALSDAEKQALRDKTLEAKRVETAAAVGKAEQQAQARASEEINRSLTDALMRGFESGKGFAQNLADTTVNLFKTMVLRPTISAIMQPVSLVINGIVQQGLSSLGIGTSGSSALGAVGNAASGLSVLSSTFGMGLRAGLSGLFGEAGLAGTISAGTTAIGAGNIAGGLGTLAGPLALVGGGLLVLNSILKATKGETRTGGQFGVAFDGSVTNQRRGQTYTYQGQQYDRDFSNGERNALINGQAYRLEGDPVAQESAIRDAVAGTATGINAFLKALGSKTTLTGFWAGLETSSKGRGGVFAGGTTSDGKTFGESGKGDNYAVTLYEKFSTNSPDFKQALSDFTLDLKQSTIQVLQTVTDIPRTVQSMLKGVDAEGLSEEAVNALLEAINAQIVGVGQLTSAFQAMGLDKLASMGFDAAAGLAAAAGGFDKLLGNLNTFYDNFYSEEERKANLQKQVDKQFAELGIDVPKNRDEFRRLVEDTLEQVDVQGKARASLSKQINDAIAGAGKDGFTLADAGARSIVSGINPALLGDAQADPALAGKLNGFLSGISDLAEKGLDPAAFQEGVAGLIDVNAEVLGIGRDASKTAAALLGLSGVFAELNQSAEDAAKAEADARKAATDAAWAAMQKSIAAAREAAQAEIDLRQQRLATAQAIVDLTRSQARELRGLVASTVAITAAQANATIDAAVLAARSGQLPEQKGLQEAISAARAGMSTSAYANRLDYEAAQLILANKLDAIGDSGQAQVDVNQLLLEQAKNEVDRLDMLIKAGQAALDEARGNTLAVRDVETAVKVFYERLFKEKDGTSGSAGAGGSAGSGGGSPTFGPGGSTGNAANAKYKTPVYLGTAGVGYQAITDPDQIAHLDKLAPTFDKYRGTGDLEGLARDIKAAGGTAKDLAALYGFYENDVNAALDRAGIARFAMGGSHLGGVRLVGENGPELEVTGPSRIYNASQTLQLLAGLQGGGNAEVVAAIRELQRQGYDIGRTLIVLMQSMENLARKQDAIGVLQREPVAT